MDVPEAFVVALPSSWSLLSWIFSWPPLTMQAGLSSMSPSHVGWPPAAPGIPKDASACMHSLPICCLLGAVHCLAPPPPPSVSSRRGGTLPTAGSQKMELCLVCGRGWIHVSRLRGELRMAPPEWRACHTPGSLCQT